MSRVEIETCGLGAGSYPEPSDRPGWPVCPACGEECSTFYTAFGNVIGCDVCIESMDAWEALYG